MPTTDPGAGLEVLVLGPLVVRHAGAAVDLGAGRRRAVLAALAADAGRIVPIDALLDRVWDGEPTDAATTALHAHVSRLRGALKAVGAAPAVIETAPRGYRLLVDPGALDANRLVDALSRARGLRDAGDAQAAARTVRDGLALWRGRPYADVLTRHAAAEADRLGGVRRAARELAVEADLSLGRHTDLLAELRELVEEDPYGEAMQGALMLALYRCGRQAEALARYAAVQRRLADDLGADPGRALQDLQARILAADPSLDVATPAARATAAGPTPAPVAEPPLLIGRDRESARLRQAVGRAWSTGAAVTVVVGEAGIGKTRLLEHLVAEVDGPEVLHAWGRSWQHEGAPRLWPWAQVLRGLAATAGPEATAAAFDGPVGAALAAIVPDLLPAAPGGSAGALTDAEGSELRVLDAYAVALRRFAEGRPVVLLLEDLHWADPASRRMAEYLATHLVEPGVAVLATVRWPSDDAVAATSGLLAGIARGGRSTRIDLEGFDADEVRRFVERRTGAEIDSATADALVERTDGNPFFVDELVRLVLQDPDGIAVVPETIPDSIREVVLARLERLPAGDRAVLDAAAVVGRTFDLALLTAVSATAEDAVDDAVDRATEHGMVMEEPGRPEEYRFTHALVQQALLESIGPARRRRLHGRAAAALLGRLGAAADANAVDVLVHHLTAAGGDDDLARAVGLLVRQADVARRRGDVGSAETALLAAVDAASRIRGQDAVGAELDARLRLYSLYTLYAPSAAATQAHRRRAIELARASGRPLDLVRAMAAQWSEAAIVFDLERIVALEAEYAALAEATDDDVLRIGAAGATTHRLLYLGRAAEALEAADAALALLARADPVPTGLFPLHPSRQLRWFRAAALHLAGREAEADAAIEQLEALDAAPDPHTGVYVDILLTELHALRGDVDAAERAVTRVHRQRRRVDIADGAVFPDVVEAWVAAGRGDPDGPDRMGALLAGTDALPTMGSRPMLRFLHAGVLLERGRAQAARDAAQRGIDEIARSGETAAEPWLLRIRGDAAAALGDPVAAERDRAAAAFRAAELGVVPDPAAAGVRPGGARRPSPR